MATTTTNDDLDGLAYDLAVLGNITRLKILGFLGEHPGSSVEDVMLSLEMPQSVISRHLQALRARGLVIFSEEDTKGGGPFKRHCYSLKSQAIQADAERLSALASPAA